jgi:hypothetical protein
MEGALPIQCHADVRAFVERRLGEMLDRPKMWAWTKEAYAAQVTLLVEFASDATWDPKRFMQGLFPGNTTGSEHLDDAWVRAVVEAARQELRAS